MTPSQQPSPQNSNRTPLEMRLLSLLFGKEYRNDSLEAIRILASKEIEISSPPCDANVAGSDSGESPTTNKACPAGFDKLDDSGRGGFISGGFAIDRAGRKRGPVNISERALWVDDEHGYDTFDLDGAWIDKADPHANDLIAPWIDWKAECERLQGLLDRAYPVIEDHDANVGLYGQLLADIRASLKGEGAGS